tara:strand:+ start:199 stop:534 length:336 start_codon:yes stop_codon:yes gene_type:complete
MKIGIVLLLLVFGQFAYADDNFCEIQDYPARGGMQEMNQYVLEQCQDGDVVKLLVTVMGLRTSDFAGKHCKMGTIYFVGENVLLCEYRKVAREVIRPSKKEWKQMQKNSKK